MISLAPPLYIEVPVLSRECDRSCICVLEVASLPPSMIFLLGVRNVPAV
jgi:hypothetical protein